jgi:hypothetical protein
MPASHNFPIESNEELNVGTTWASSADDGTPGKMRLVVWLDLTHAPLGKDTVTGVVAAKSDVVA